MLYNSNIDSFYITIICYVFVFVEVYSTKTKHSTFQCSTIIDPDSINNEATLLKISQCYFADI